MVWHLAFSFLIPQRKQDPVSWTRFWRCGPQSPPAHPIPKLLITIVSPRRPDLIRIVSSRRPDLIRIVPPGDLIFAVLHPEAGLPWWVRW